MADIERVLIVGGGIAGLTLGRALHCQGLSVEIAECSLNWRADGGGILVQANGMRMLRAIGLAAAVDRAGVRVRRWRFCDQAGHVLCETDLEALWDNVGPCIGIERTRLQEALVTGVAGVPCRLGTSITSLSQSDESVSIKFSDGSLDRYDLVVGADGISSTVRALAMGSATGPKPLAYTGAMAWRSIVALRPRGLDALQFVLGDGCFFGLCPTGDGGTYGFGNFTEARTREPVVGRLDRLRRRCAGFGGIVQDYLSALTSDEQIHCAPVDWLLLETWLHGRVVLILVSMDEPILRAFRTRRWSVFICLHKWPLGQARAGRWLRPSSAVMMETTERVTMQPPPRYGNVKGHLWHEGGLKKTV
jgi:2-polyprenyl-6-methoxyphenol hydroxylase-like FAD-dependent oxidoreductase